MAVFEPFEAAPTHCCHCFLRNGSAHCGRRHVASVSGFGQAKPERAAAEAGISLTMLSRGAMLSLTEPVLR